MKIFEEVFIIMYLNTKLVNRMEEMCINKEIPYFRNRMFDRGFFGFGHFVHQMDEMNQEDNPFNKRYNLSKIKDHVDLEACLGAEFLNMDLSMIDVKNKNLDAEGFFDSDDHDLFIKGMLNRYRGKDKQELANGLEFKVMSFERNFQITLHNLQEFFIFQDMLNCSPLVNEWLTFAKKHKINIDDELKDVISFIEKDKGGFKLYENLMEEFSPLKRAAFNLMRKFHNKMRNSHTNRMFFHPNHREETTDSQAKHVEIELIQEIDTLELKMKEFIKKIKNVTKVINNDYFCEVEIAHNNNLLIESLFAAYQKLKLKHKIVLPKTQATIFIDAIKNEKDDLSVLDKLIERYNNHILFIGENIKFENERYKKVILFTDATCIVIDQNHEDFEIFANIKNFKNLVKTCIIVYLKSVLHKNPSIAKVIVQAFSEIIGKVNNKNEYRHHASLQLNKILLSIDTYFKNENILKSLKYDFMAACKTAKSFEKVDDEMHKLIREHKIKKFAESIVSSKYKHLYNKESYKLFQELYDLSIDTKTLQEMIGKKLAAVETKKIFNENIKKLINSLNEFDMDSVKLKANSYGAKIITDEKEILILEIENFNQSQKLGSASWCISRNQSYFEQYTDKGGKQYFIYDFNQDSKNVKSLIGITLTKTFKVKAAHTKSDSQFKDKEMIDYLIEKVKPIEIEKKPAATRKSRSKKVVTATEIAIPNIGF